MGVEELKFALLEIGYPCAYRAFKQAPTIPFLVYFQTDTDNFSADDEVYVAATNYVVELYTQEKDLLAEERVEAVFQRLELFWEKQEVYIDSEKLFETIYYIQI